MQRICVPCNPDFWSAPHAVNMTLERLQELRDQATAARRAAAEAEAASDLARWQVQMMLYRQLNEYARAIEHLHDDMKLEAQGMLLGGHLGSERAFVESFGDHYHYHLRLYENDNTVPPRWIRPLSYWAAIK